MASQSRIQTFLSLTDKQKEAEVKRALHAKPRALSASQRAHWKKVQRSLQVAHAKKRGRPLQGDGVQIISLSVEKNLLKRADARAKREGISRAQLIAIGLNMILS